LSPFSTPFGVSTETCSTVGSNSSVKFATPLYSRVHPAVFPLIQLMPPTPA
jgi:hypothetical protein